MASSKVPEPYSYEHALSTPVCAIDLGTSRCVCVPKNVFFPSTSFSPLSHGVCLP